MSVERVAVAWLTHQHDRAIHLGPKQYINRGAGGDKYRRTKCTVL